MKLKIIERNIDDTKVSQPLIDTHTFTRTVHKHKSLLRLNFIYLNVTGE